MEIKDVRNHLIDGFEDNYSDEDIEWIDTRLGEVAKENNLTPEELDCFCYADSNEMFDCIFEGKPFVKNNFK